jgi:phosphoribosyl-AMP cyclohydrolase
MADAEGKSLQEFYAPGNACFGCGPANPDGLHIRSFVRQPVINPALGLARLQHALERREMCGRGKAIGDVAGPTRQPRAVLSVTQNRRDRVPETVRTGRAVYFSRSRNRLCRMRREPSKVSALSSSACSTG